MGPLGGELMTLSAAEDFFRHFDVGYDPALVAVYRLHIMRRFGRLLETVNWSGLDDTEARTAYRGCLIKALAEAPGNVSLVERRNQGFVALVDIAPPRGPASRL